jgi:excinuclease ABC subunit C
MVGLAKRREELIIHKQLSIPALDIDKLLAEAAAQNAYITDSSDFISITLPERSTVVKLLQRIRDESHRFAVSYHTTLKRGRLKQSILDEIPGVGPTTKKKLVRHFGSVKGIMNAQPEEFQAVLGKQRGASFAKYIASYKT